MKIKTFLLLLFTFTMLGIGGAWAQNDEYYRPDSLRTKKPVEYQPAERKAIPAPQEAPSEFSLRAPIDRVRLGGSFGLSFGTVTNINLSPMAGYELTEKLVGGVGGTIMYFKSRYYNISTAYYGGRGFLMYAIAPMVNLIGEYEAMNVEGSYQKRQWLGSPMFGASYTQPLGGRFTKGVHLTILYNFNYNNQIDQYSGQNLSPYSSPFVFRVTFL
ncbi:hypothetical protein CLV98_101248 [Dyadobacter jejuensis]|uniref:Outer membrane protein with beta-barrel domain n=1 Tax=Dyadobacter jejuensis TaxID=1082580 RepID=A0A316AR35_9BACT|nr:hypothetical protein [Dyadobacter jejuensis]PWJ60072.1 hypothetical protein CLV98_101248 [Dyadobacter jejuensis]